MKKTTVYITISLVLILLYFRTKKTRSEITTTPTVINPSSNDLQTAFTEAKNNFGPAFAQKLEQLFRWETGHFRSGQFLEGNSPGMVANSTEYPFGWPSLDEYNKEKGIDGRRYSVGRVFVVDGKNYRYVKFPDFRTALNFVAWFIRMKRGGNFGQWNSLNASASEKYLQDLNTIKPRFT